ncbi:peroxisomal catalase 1-like [Brevipalpus obovatus]|uniref:peroxisomal catalase 1-like n=1 Tax=Brevipalpus obovatus TaxID=246614 RepID=UPI003D9E68E2
MLKMYAFWAINFMLLPVVTINGERVTNLARDYQVENFINHTTGTRGQLSEEKKDIQAFPELLRSLSIGKNGPILLPDAIFLEKISRFNRERPVTRTPFSRGSGALGFFECKKPLLAPFTKAKVFNECGKKVKLMARFSDALSEYGRGEVGHRTINSFTIRMYTDEGILDIITGTTVSIAHDPFRAAAAGHALRPNHNNIEDINSLGDWAKLVPECLLDFTMARSDYTVPNSLQAMQTLSTGRFTLINGKGQPNHVLFSLKPLTKIGYIPDEEVEWINGRIPDFYTRDLFARIERGDHPRWMLRAQIISPRREEQLDFNIFDISKIWNETDFPPIPVGVITLNENPSNFFSTIEQVALNPANLIPGIELGIKDYVTQSRNLIYRDSHLNRLGPNFFQLEVNKPKFLQSTVQDGTCRQSKGPSESNYYPSIFSNLITSEEGQILSGRFNQTTRIRRFITLYDDNYSQVTRYWDSLDKGHQTRVAKRFSADIFKMNDSARKGILNQLKRVGEKFYGKVVYYLEKLESQ